MALSGKVGAVFVQTSAVPVMFIDEQMGSTNYKEFAIKDSDKRYWNKNSPFTVKVNDVTTTSGFKIQHCGGIVVFDSSLSSEDIVTVSGSYHTVEQHAGFFNWTVDLEMDTTEVTTFKSGGWKENLPTIKGFKASAEAYWGDSDFFKNLGKEMIFSFYVDTTSSKERYEGFGVIASDSIETSIDDVVNESIEIQGMGEIYYREG